MSSDSEFDLAELQRLRQWARVLRGLRMTAGSPDRSLGGCLVAVVLVPILGTLFVVTKVVDHYYLNVVCWLVMSGALLAVPVWKLVARILWCAVPDAPEARRYAAQTVTYRLLAIVIVFAAVTQALLSYLPAASEWVWWLARAGCTILFIVTFAISHVSDRGFVAHVWRHFRGNKTERPNTDQKAGASMFWNLPSVFWKLLRYPDGILLVLLVIGGIWLAIGLSYIMPSAFLLAFMAHIWNPQIGDEQFRELAEQAAASIEEMLDECGHAV